MKRVIGIGGIFFRAENPKALAEWYEKHLGIDFGGNTYSDFQFQEIEKGWTAFSIFKDDTKYSSLPKNNLCSICASKI